MKDKRNIKQRAFKFLSGFGDNLRAKFSNICGKTGQYNVPKELYQKRTPRKNRALLSWKVICNNNLTYEQLEAFEGGVVVDFINNDFFDDESKYKGTLLALFRILKKRLGSDEVVSSIISIKSEEGSSSSEIQRKAFDKLVNNTKVLYKGEEIIINKMNYMSYAIKQNIRAAGQGNHTWNGFLYISIKGGQQDKIETHKDQELTLFNPACEYASNDVCLDIDLVMAYYALHSIDENNLRLTDEEGWIEYKFLIKDIEDILKNTKYDNESYKGNLYDCVKKQYSLSLISGQLTDPIQLKEISIDKFNISERKEDSIDFTHEEAVFSEKYYWDNEKKTILSPARPTNVFWSYHLSNMMQQNYGLDDYFELEKKRYYMRKNLINKQNIE